MIPNVLAAVVEPAKVRDYLLSTSHPVGRFKATVFLSLGYTRENWAQLQTDLLVMVRTEQALRGQNSKYGQKYEVSGILRGPNGRQARFTTIWMVAAAENVPRLITAFPG